VSELTRIGRRYFLYIYNCVILTTVLSPSLLLLAPVPVGTL
jgi:hypothetical protein